MFNPFQRKPDLPPVPDWANFFTPEEYAHFLKAVDAYFKNKKLDYELDDGMVKLKTNEFGFGNLGLTNVAQICQQRKTNEYAKIVSQHFDSMANANKFNTEFEKIVGDFEKVKEYIAVRLYPAGYTAHIGKNNTLGKDLAEDIYAMLVFDLPYSVMNVRPEQADKWNKTNEELFNIGVENIKNKYEFDVSEQDLRGIKIWFVHGDHFFTPNIVLDLANRKNLLGRKGALIGIPHRHAVIIYPIETVELIKAINEVIPLTHFMNQKGPGSISAHVFWYHDGVLEDLPYKIEEQKLQFYPPEKFVGLLNSFSAN